MNMPSIRYYAKMEYSTAAGKKTPKYTITAQAGYYPPMESMKGRDGTISFHLLENKKGIDVPPYRLQGKNSYNMTGLKDYFAEGKLTGYAYGEPMQKECYSKCAKPNPFYEYRQDGYMFVIHQSDNDKSITPIAIEFVVLEYAKPLIGSYCKMLQQGGFDEALEIIRKQAK